MGLQNTQLGKTEKFHAEGDHRFPYPGAAFVALVEARRRIERAAGRGTRRWLVLILANHIGDPDILVEAIALAKD
jgi:hypothetical protein